MTTVAFHLHVDDRLNYACRLVRKAVATGKRLVVTGSTDVLAQLDRDLWALSGTDFLTHCHADEAGSRAQRSAVVLCESLEGVTGRDVLVNLADAVPEGATAFDRVVEVVTTDPLELRQARLRWKHYVAAGVNLVQHDLGHRTTA